MSERTKANRTLIETARAIAAEEPPVDVVAAAAGRVRLALAAAVEAAPASAAGTISEATPSAAHVEAGRSSAALVDCADYRARMPALVAGTLSEGQRLLVEDHTRECIPCRRYLQAVRAGRAVATAPAPQAPPRVGRYWAAAAALVGVAVSSAWLGHRLLQPPQRDVLQVQSVDGRLFLAGSGPAAGLVPLGPGDTIDGGDSVRTGAGSRGVFELADGSRLEAAGLTTFRVDARRSGHRVRVDRGSLIVQAAEQENGTLLVSTDEMLVSVRGTIFAVTHGVKGSRVSVIEGEVEVEQGQVRHSLLAGDQLQSRTTLAALTLQEEVGWSQNAEQYLSLLEEFRTLRSELNQLMDAAGPRHSTRLLNLMPADTRAYLAVPNATATLSDLADLVRSRVASSPALAEWWSAIESSYELAVADEVIARLRELGDAMGDETVVALAGAGPVPVAVTEVTDAAGLRDALQVHLDEAAEEDVAIPVQIVEDLNSVSDGQAGFVVWIVDDLAAASTSLDVLRTVALNHEEAAGNPFVGSRLHGRLAERYAAGAEIVGAVDLASLFRGEIEGEDEAAVLAFTGLDAVQDLVVSRTQDGERANLTAVVRFDGPRRGMVSWLEQPGANGALEFFSPDASFVSAGVIEDPLMIWDQLVGFIERQGSDPDAGLAELESSLGLSLRNDVMVYLGGEYAAGLDGPVLPTPSFKAVASVYDGDGLQRAIETLVAKANELASAAVAGGQITLDELRSSGRTVYRLGSTLTPDEPSAGPGGDDSDASDADPGERLRGVLETSEIFYTYFDGYMVSASSTAAIDDAIRYRGSGASLVDSQRFVDLLPRNGYASFSAVVYNRLAETASDLLGMLPPVPVDGDGQEVMQTIEESLTGAGPALYTVYAGQSEIVVTSSGPSLLAFTGLSQVLGLGALLDSFDALDADEAAEEAGPAADPPPSAGDADVVAGIWLRDRAAGPSSMAMAAAAAFARSGLSAGLVRS